MSDTQVLAVLGGGPAEAPVIDTAAALAEIAHARVRRVSLAADLSAEQAEAQVLGALDSPGIVLAVLARDERSRPIWGASRSGPPGRWSWCPPRRGAGGRRSAGCSCRWTGRRSRQRRWPVRWNSSLAPESISWRCTCSTLRPCHGSGIRPRTPRRAWAEEFLARYCAQPEVRLELRTGVAGEHVLDVAEAERADMIALGWSQQLDPGRAHTVRRAVLDAVVPVMLVPIAPG